MLDELNKYAPRDSSSPIKEILLDVAERGRSLGIMLIGAQQTASEVERRVVANSAIRVVGRLDSAEAGRDEYGFLPAVQRQRATILKPGSMYLVQPRLPVPLLVEFPFPAWATRAARPTPPANAPTSWRPEVRPRTRSTGSTSRGVKLLHTSDWHVGKAIRGHSRADEHRAVLAEIASIAGEHDVDLVVVAGDLFETAAPSAEAEQIVYRALLDLAGTGAEVAVIAGNHDNARRLRAVAPLLELGRVHLVTQPRAARRGRGHRTVRPSRRRARPAGALPFVSQRGIVRSEQLMEQAAYQHAQDYAQRLQLLIHTLVDACDPEVPTVVAAHAFVRGGAPGGGERLAHLVEEYAVPATVVPGLGRTTSPSVISTGPRSSPAPPPSTTAGRRSSWTSARRTRPSRSTWSSSRPVRRRR